MKRLLVIAGLLLLLSLNAEAATYWVDGTNGNDSNGCNNSATPLTTTAKRTIYHAIETCMNGGDTLYIRAGVYAETLGNFNSATRSIFPNGTPGAYTKIARWQSESVTIRPPFSGAGCHGFANGGCRALYLLANRYIEFDGLILDGVNQTVNDNGGSCTFVPVGAQAILLQSSDGTESSANPDDYTHHIRFKNLEVKNWPGYMISQKHPNVASFDYNAIGGIEILNSHIHHVGLDRYVGAGVALYMSTSNWVVKGNTFHDMPLAITIYNTFGRPYVRGAIITENTFYNIANVHPGCDGGPAIIVAAASADPIISNNVFYNNTVGTSGQAGIRVTGGNNTRIINNTFYNTSGSGYEITLENNVVSTGGGAVNTVLANNIIWRSSGKAISQEVNATTTYMTNLCREAGTGCAVIAGNATNIFVSPSSNDFRLKAGSPASGAGTNISALTTNVPAGLVRTQNSAAWDIGASISSGPGISVTGTVPTSPRNLRVAIP